MDGGQLIAVRVDIDRERRRARIDFTGTSPQGAHNFNAPRAVCTAAVLYVFRTLLERPIPLNEGCLEPLEIVIPAGSLLDPRPPAAVAGGNVETSQCIVDALYGALGILAASQGTMNNLTFGDAHLQYYETIAGGAGAGADFDGCDAVQTHMTNSRLTDPEILESEFPVLVREFSIRRGSGGSGRHHGGDGIVRRLEFRAQFSGALLANHRRIAPFGLQGGQPGVCGEARIRRAGGALEPLGATARFDVAPGDELTILTPGGGRLRLTAHVTERRRPERSFRRQNPRILPARLNAVGGLARRKRRCRTRSFRRQKPRLLPACPGAAGRLARRKRRPALSAYQRRIAVSISHSTRCFAVSERFTDTGRTRLAPAR